MLAEPLVCLKYMFTQPFVDRKDSLIAIMR